MDNNRFSPISITQTVPRQTQTKEFGEVMRDALKGATAAVSAVTGGLMGSVPGVGLVSAAVSGVTNAVSKSSSAATGVQTLPGKGTPGSTETLTGSSDMNDMMRQMRAEADHSVMVQMQMQQESRDYNTLSNVLKTRHDSAKAAINNIR